MAHGLNCENHLARFAAFALPDSSALLSVTYAERPETKFRFFKPQGGVGIADTFNIAAGGATDEGSGYKKNIRQFHYRLKQGSGKRNRKYISETIKKATGMNDFEYRNFVLENQNKPFSEIYPENLRNKIIQALGRMKSKKEPFQENIMNFTLQILNRCHHLPTILVTCRLAIPLSF